jgi:hypothetical protein
MASLITRGWTPGANVSAYGGLSLAASRGDAQAAGAAIETVAADAAGTATHITLANDTPYVLQQAGAARTVRARLSTQDTGRTVGTGDVTNAALTIANAAATTGTWRVGQRITGIGIPPGVFIKSISGATLTLSQAATATNVGTALEGHGGFKWQAKLAQRRNAAGTS